MKNYIIYQPPGRAGEYAKWAANFYKTCSAGCVYCYNKKYFPNNCKPVLKKSLTDEGTAFEIFNKEFLNNLDELRKFGLFFNFISDPFLTDTINLNIRCMRVASSHNVPIIALTKQTWWIDDFLVSSIHVEQKLDTCCFGFTLTGRDDLEPGTGSNESRIESMKKLYLKNYVTWASIEPVIDIDKSMDMIFKTIGFCYHYKIGLLSGAKFNRDDLVKFINVANHYAAHHERTIYWKNNILAQAGFERCYMLNMCVDKYYPFWER